MVQKIETLMNRRPTRRLGRVLLLFGMWLVALGLAAWMVMICDPGPREAQRALETGLWTEQIEVERRLRGHVGMLATTIGPRDTYRNPQRLGQSGDYVSTKLKDYGYEVTEQRYSADGVESRNLEVSRRGTARPDEIILIGAHYDSVPQSPGANDNASGTAALLELARVWAEKSGPRTVRFVAFANEEPPHFMRDARGSRVYARMARERGDRIVAMLSLETIGYFSEQKDSQKYPVGFRSFYPATGNFLAIVGNVASRPLVRRVTRAFRQATDLPSECVATFGWIPGVNWSDHASFWEQGYKAVMLTDTAPFRYPHYHTVEDTPDKLDFTAMSRVTLAVDHVIEILATVE